MSIYYQLLDLVSGNIIDEYESETAALSELSGAVEEFGPAEVRQNALFRMRDGEQELIAMEDELVQLIADFEQSSLAGRQAITQATS